MCSARDIPERCIRSLGSFPTRHPASLTPDTSDTPAAPTKPDTCPGCAHVPRKARTLIHLIRLIRISPQSPGHFLGTVWIRGERASCRVLLRCPGRGLPLRRRAQVPAAAPHRLQHPAAVVPLRGGRNCPDQGLHPAVHALRRQGRAERQGHRPRGDARGGPPLYAPRPLRDLLGHLRGRRRGGLDDPPGLSWLRGLRAAGGVPAFL
eukprot:6270979-Alexandrium_andersonii.AAC.1